jgi:ParB family chromosome partitioning protein
MHIVVPLSKLVPGHRDIRKVKPEKEAHKRLVASIRAFGVIEPLVLRPTENGSKCFRVIAGNRRLSALRQVYRESKEDPKVPCELRKVDDPTADALALSENFAREAMHPLDEAEAFARLACDEGKGVESIAAEFGVSKQYVRQRMKLATLAPVVREAYREDRIDTGTAEAFAAVPEERQVEVWQEVGGNPHHARQIRNIIDARWIDASFALFDPASLPECSVSRDLFAERVLIERQAFMEAQTAALVKEKEKLSEEGWQEVVVSAQGEVQHLPQPVRDGQGTDRAGAMCQAEAGEDRKAMGGDQSQDGQSDRGFFPLPCRT